jgi:predicted O-methyltransferase YrrM
VEVDAHHAVVARSNIANAGLEDRVDVRLGPGIDVLLQLAQEVEAREKSFNWFSSMQIRRTTGTTWIWR